MKHISERFKITARHDDKCGIDQPLELACKENLGITVTAQGGEIAIEGSPRKLVTAFSRGYFDESAQDSIRNSISLFRFRHRSERSHTYPITHLPDTTITLTRMPAR